MRKFAAAAAFLCILSLVFTLIALADTKWSSRTINGVEVEAGLWKICGSASGSTSCQNFYPGAKCKSQGITCNQRRDCGECSDLNGIRASVIFAMILGGAATILFMIATCVDAFAKGKVRAGQVLVFICAFLCFLSVGLYGDVKDHFLRDFSYAADFVLLVFAGLFYMVSGILSCVDMGKYRTD